LSARLLLGLGERCRILGVSGSEQLVDLAHGEILDRHD